jgi:hypothetical protein
MSKVAITASARVMLHAELSELGAAPQDMNRWWIERSATQSAIGLTETVCFGFIRGDESTMTRQRFCCTS